MTISGCTGTKDVPESRSGERLNHPRYCTGHGARGCPRAYTLCGAGEVSLRRPYALCTPPAEVPPWSPHTDPDPVRLVSSGRECLPSGLSGRSRVTLRRPKVWVTPGRNSGVRGTCGQLRRFRDARWRPGVSTEETTPVGEHQPVTRVKGPSRGKGSTGNPDTRLDSLDGPHRVH